MRIVCPNCAAAYDVPEALLTGRKAVSCARCGQEWQPAEAVAADALAVDDLPEVPAMPEQEQQVVTWLEPPPPPVRPAYSDIPDRRATRDRAIDRLMAAPPPPPDQGAGLLLAWVASVVVLLVLAGALYVWRADVMAAWPPSERLYAALGLAR